MAARLVRRCCCRPPQLFGACGAAPRAAPAFLRAAACKAGRAGRPGAPLALVPASSLCRRAERVSPGAARETSAAAEEERIEDLIKAASSPEDLLGVLERHAPGGRQASSAIFQLARLVKEQGLASQGILQDARFQQALRLVDQQISHLWNGTLLSLFKSLHFLGVERNNREMRSVKQEIHWRLKRMNIKHLGSLTKYLLLIKQTEDEDMLLKDCLRQLELRWMEVEDPKVVAALMEVGHLSETLMNRLEDKALEVAEKFSIEDIRKVVVALAIQSRRSVPLLRAISYHLIQKDFAPSINTAVDLTYAYGKLNFHQTQVFQKIASQLQGQLPQMTFRDIGRCLRSFSHLKWLNLSLFETVTQYFLDNADSFPTFHLYSFILTYAHLNFQPSKAERFYEEVHKKIGDHLGTIDPHMQLDVVWSLCVLQQAKTPYLQKVLSPEFCSQFLADNQSSRGRGYLLKLWHINATAMLESPGYPGPLLSPEALNKTWWPEQRKVSPEDQCLQEALNQVVRTNVHRRYNVQTIYGSVLGAEMVLSSDGEHLPVEDFASPHMFQSGSTTPLPPGAKRVAFMMWEFPNFVSKSKDLLGRFVMARRHLQVAGFLVVDVRYYDFMDLSSESQKATYLKNKLSQVTAEEMAK